MEPRRGANIPPDKPGSRSGAGARKPASASPGRHRPRRGHDDRDRGGTRSPDRPGGLLPSFPSDGRSPRDPQPALQQRRMQGVRGHKVRPAGDRKAAPSGGICPESVDPASASEAASPAGRGPGLVGTSSDTATAVASCQPSPPSPVSDGVRSGALSAALPLPTLSSSRDIEQRALGQPPGLRSNPCSVQDSTKSPADSQRPNSRLRLTLGVLGATAIVALVVLAISSLLWKSPAPLSNACKTHACLAYSTRLLASINESVNPCQSFTHFVCDGWRQKNEDDVWEDQFISVLGRMTTALKNTYVPVSGQSQEQRAAILYRSCIDVFEGERDELPAVKHALAEAGIVWPKPSRGSDVLHTLLYSSLKLGWDVILDFDVAPRDGAINLVPGKFLYFVMYRHKSLMSDRNEAYFEFLKERFRRDGEDTVTYQDTQASAEQNLVNLYYAHYTTSGKHAADSFLNTAELGLTEPNWMAKLLNLDIRMNGSISMTTTSPHYMELVLGLWLLNGSDSFHTLISWCTIQIAALFANKDLIFNYYNRDYTRTQVYYSVFCVTRAMFFSRLTLFDKYNAEALKGDALDLAKNVSLSVQTSFFRRLSNWTYFDEDITVVSNWSSQEMVFRNFERRGEDESATTDQIPDLNNSFVWDWQQSVHVRKVPGFEYIQRSMHRLEYFAVFYDKRNFELMPYTLSFPLFDSQLPPSVNYGGLGSEIAAALGYLFYVAYIESNVPHVNALIDCLEAGTSDKFISKLYYATRVVGYGALVDAYDAEGRASDNGVFGLEKYSGLQLFFIALCYGECNGSRYNRAGESVCSLALQYVHQFAEAFHCAPEDPMNPTKRCELF